MSFCTIFGTWPGVWPGVNSSALCQKVDFVQLTGPLPFCQVTPQRLCVSSATVRWNPTVTVLKDKRLRYQTQLPLSFGRAQSTKLCSKLGLVLSTYFLPVNSSRRTTPMPYKLLLAVWWPVQFKQISVMKNIIILQ